MPVVAQKRRRGRMTFLARRRRGLQQIGPYLSLLILLVPLLLVEPLKLVAVIIAGKGHWLTGTAVLVAAYAASLLVIERLFRVLKPKIMMMGWFNRLWTGFVALRERLWRRLARLQDDLRTSGASGGSSRGALAKPTVERPQKKHTR
jgi:hypothetical protein